MAVSSSTNCKIFIGGTGDIGSESGWVEVKKIEDLGEVGDNQQIISFDTLDDGRTQKLKGQRDAGDVAVIVAFDVEDLGQDAMRAAAADIGVLPYNFKIELNDQITPSTGNVTDIQFKAHVTSAPVQIGSANQEVRQTFTLAITTTPSQTDAT